MSIPNVATKCFYAQITPSHSFCKEFGMLLKKSIHSLATSNTHTTKMAFYASSLNDVIAALPDQEYFKKKVNNIITDFLNSGEAAPSNPSFKVSAHSHLFRLTSKEKRTQIYHLDLDGVALDPQNRYSYEITQIQGQTNHFQVKVSNLQQPPTNESEETTQNDSKPQGEYVWVEHPAEEGHTNLGVGVKAIEQENS